MLSLSGKNGLDVCSELLEIIEKQNEVISKMAIDNLEKENMINVLMEECDGLY